MEAFEKAREALNACQVELEETRRELREARSRNSVCSCADCAVHSPGRVQDGVERVVDVTTMRELLDASSTEMLVEAVFRIVRERDSMRKELEGVRVALGTPVGDLAYHAGRVKGEAKRRDALLAESASLFPPKNSVRGRCERAIRHKQCHSATDAVSLDDLQKLLAAVDAAHVVAASGPSATDYANLRIALTDVDK